MSLHRFFARITANALDPRERAVLITAFGDSVTQGVMAHRLLEGASTFHRRLQLELEAFFPTTTFQILNSGVAGDTAAKSLDRLERDVLVYQPDLVLIGFGANDSLGGLEALDRFENALTQLVLRIREETPAEILLLTPAFMATRPSSSVHPEHAEYSEIIVRSQNDGTLGAFCERIRQVAGRMNVVLVDIAAEWQRLKDSGVDTDLWLVNGLNHPDSRGHRLAAALLFHTLLSERPRTKSM